MANVKVLVLGFALLASLTDGAVIKNSTERVSNCASGYHECINGQCIPNAYVCDGYSDCSYGEDEDNCYQYSTTSSSTSCGFACWDGSCISEGSVCNGVSDCSWGEDEYCSTYEPSTSECGFTCWNGHCIPESWVCDGISDCSEGEDEYCGSSDTTASPSIPQSTPSSVSTPSPPAECNAPFDQVGGKCVLVDIFETVTWAEARYLCEKFGADLVTLESVDFYAELLDFLNLKGLAGHDFWVGANDTETEGEWAWLNGTPVRMGTPLWALYRYSSSDYEQEPTTSSSGSTSGDCAYMDQSRFLYLADDDCGSVKGAICQRDPGASAADKTRPAPERKPRRRH
ncbi:macrophage mannose receptor 1-like [Penaeus japonicus]|uniref:macrophage mannose receptor 1-like n=1 Tax=Penaeus japonicus TaxID=27405 RepID=UPI001C710D43|nr:macrophage mannose receptor 1-like [Penaeus japonicus]